MKKYISLTALALFLSMTLFPSVALGQVSDGTESEVRRVHEIRKGKAEGTLREHAESAA